MLTKIIMPESGQTTTESKFTSWRKMPGDRVERGDILFEIETDKANAEIESCASGTLLAVYAEPGDIVESGQIVAYVGDPNDVLPESESKSSSVAITIPDQTGAVSDTVATSGTFASGKSFPATPKAKSLAKAKNIDLAAISTANPGKILHVADVEAFLAIPATPAIPVTPPAETDGAYAIKASSMRKAIARRMTESARTIPSYCVSVRADMTRTAEMRTLLNKNSDKTGVKISFNDIIMKCAARAIAAYPLVNASYAGGDTITAYRHVNFGLAVSLPEGLLVPVVRAVETLPFERIAKANSANVERARAGKLVESDMSGGTITLTNLGMLGADSFNAIINPPESCILAVGRIAETPVSLNGAVVSRLTADITASFDHRLIDGAYGAAFLAELKNYLENPALLLT